MATVVRMPSVLAGAAEAALARWLVAPGDTVTVGTPIAEIETEKAVVEYEAETAGVVGRLILREGDTGEIGDPIAVLVAASETDADIDAALGITPAATTAATPAPAAPGPATAAPTASVPTAPGPATAAPPTTGPTAPADAAPADAAPAAVTTSAKTSATTGRAAPRPNGQHTPHSGRVFASPLVRKLAGEHGIDLARLAGTGPSGRITRRDLERFLAGAPAPAGSSAVRPTAPPALPPVLPPALPPGLPPALPPGLPPVLPPDTRGRVPGGGEAEHELVLDEAQAPQPTAAGGTTSAGGTLVPHTPMRRAIARRLTESKASVPHFYLTAEPVVDELLALRQRVNRAAPAGEPGPAKVSVNDFVIAAVAAAFGDVPEANVTWSAEGLVTYRSVDISIAVATGGGLVTPVLRGVERMKLSAIARESAALAQRARERRLLQHELEGGTFAVSNLGMYGIVEFAAIINPPQSGILAVGAARQQPVAVDGALSVATVMRCTLSVDHRAIDGALAARWLAAFTARLENPLGALI